AAAGSDLVLLSVPVAATGSVLAELRGALGPRALCMDVGSTKRDVVQAAHDTLGDAVTRFVGAHPIAGKEHAGIAHADSELYRDRQVVLTPDATSDKARVARARACWEAVGARVIEMDPQAHDRAFAAVSHLPHLLAFASFEAVAAQAGGETLLALAGPGFRDFTRIAAGEPAMWRDILLANRDEVRAQAAHFRAALDGLEALLDAADSTALHDRLAAISARRARWRMRGRFD
ncbi:MAG: hypothetical protein RI988_1022, partial [Pseudomonadota bacterium]